MMNKLIDVFGVISGFLGMIFQSEWAPMVAESNRILVFGVMLLTVILCVDHLFDKKSGDKE